MLDQILSEETKVPAENSKAVGKSKNEPAACTIQGNGLAQKRTRDGDLL